MNELTILAAQLNADGMRLLINTAKSLSLSSRYKAHETQRSFDKEVDRVLAMVNGGDR